MAFLSILNDVLGPVMRGPSSSHTAGSYRIGRMARSLLGREPRAAAVSFDPGGSYAMVYRQQGVDLAFAAGLMGWSIMDERFERALDEAERTGLRLDFRVADLPGADHPNTVLLELSDNRGERINLRARSTGGGGVSIDMIDCFPVALDGKACEIVMEVDSEHREEVIRVALKMGWKSFHWPDADPAAEGPVVFRAAECPGAGELENFRPLVSRIRICPPVFFVKRGDALFDDYAGLLRAAEKHRRSLGEAALEGEARVLGLTRGRVIDELLERFSIMQKAVETGMNPDRIHMSLLTPSADRIFAAESRGGLAAGGLPTRAAARALAVMHVCNSRGTVCAAPTGGSAGALAGVLVTLAREREIQGEALARSMMAAGAVGWLIARRSTFAAEVAGCQVEIGAAGAMSAAAVVEASGGIARIACDAAAVSLQNTMGSVCDLVQGMCEIPCHTRNAVAASSAFICADLVMGGYLNPIPLDETIDAMDEVGRKLPVELRCTARGGLAVSPSALALPRRPAGSDSGSRGDRD